MIIMITIQISPKIIIRNDTIFFYNKNQAHQEKFKAKDVDIWIATKTIQNAPIKEHTISKLKTLKGILTTQFISKPKTETKKPKTKQSIPIEKLKIVIVKTPTLHINISNSLFLIPNEFCNFVRHTLHKELTTTTKYKLGTYITPTNSKKKIEINQEEIKKAYQELIGMGIKIPIYLKSEIDSIYRWQ